MDGKSAYIVTEMSLRKSADLPVSDSRSPAPNASVTRSRWLALKAKSLQVRMPVTVSDAENGVRSFGFEPNNATTRLWRLRSNSIRRTELWIARSVAALTALAGTDFWTEPSSRALQPGRAMLSKTQYAKARLSFVINV